MKQITRLLSTAVLLVAAASVQAQFLRTSYFMEGTHYRQQLNPALMPGRGYINLPVIGSLNATVNSNSLGYNDIVDIIDNSEDGDYFTSNDFMNRLNSENRLNVNLSTDILSAGWYKGRNFWSFNVGVRSDIGASIPKSMFQFMNKMNGLKGGEDLDVNSFLGLNENIGPQELEINMYTEIGVGWARAINDKLNVGARVKAILGIGNVQLNIDRINVTSSTTGGQIEAVARLESSSKLIELQENEDGYIDEIEFGDFGIAGYGAAIDLGASYKLLDKLTLSASVLDLGFVKWDKKNTQVAESRASESFNFSNPDEAYDFADKVSSGEVLNFDMLEMEVSERGEKSRSSSLTSTVVVGAEYELLNDFLVLGALYTGRFTKPKALNELTFSANIRPKNYFNLAASYSVLQGAGKTIGLAAKLGPLFVGTDYMFFGENTKNINAYVGFSIPLGRMKKQN